MQFKEGLPELKLNKNEKKYRIFDILQQIKDCIMKKKYNQGWEQAAKYYEQNKSSLNNDEIYQLCWQSCISIQKKLHNRLVFSTRTYTPPVTQTHMQHLLSLYLSLHNFILPQVIAYDKHYFSMLAHTQEILSPRTISPNDLTFERKEQPKFMSEAAVKKELRKLVKEHLKICNIGLMYRSLRKKSPEQISQSINTVQRIFDSFKEHEFPSETMNFQLIKLSIIEDLGLKQQIFCEYRLPVGYLNKIYWYIRQNQEEAVDHHIKKLISFLVLCIRNLFISIEDIYILCSELQTLIRAIHDKYTPISSQILDFKKKLPHLRVARQLTIDRDAIDQSSSKKNGSISTYTKISEKKLQSKKRIFKPDSKLKAVITMAMQKINNYLNSRRQIQSIILSYYSQGYIRNHRTEHNDEIIENEVTIQNGKKNKKNVNEPNEAEEIPLKLKQRKRFKSLTAMFQKNRLEKKISNFQDGQQMEKLTMDVPSKNQGKFILKNIDLVSSHKPLLQNNDLATKMLSKVTDLDQIQILDESSSDSDGQLTYQFEKLRRKQFLELNARHKSAKLKQKMKQKKDSGLFESDQQQAASNEIDSSSDQSQRIRLLDEVITETINTMLDLQPRQGKNRGFHSHSSNPILGKLQNLKMEVETLNLERRLLVQRLNLKHNPQSSQLQSSGAQTHDQILSIDKKHEQIQRFTENFKSKIDEYVKSNHRLMNLSKVKKAISSTQPTIRLQLEKTSKKMPELTINRLQEEYRRLDGGPEKKEIWDMFLSCQFDKLRRDVAKNQFASQNEKKNSTTKDKCKTIPQISQDEDAF